MRRLVCILSLAFSFPTIGQAQQHGSVMPAAPAVHSPAGAAAPMIAPRPAPARPMVSAHPAGQPGPVSTRVTAAPRTPRHAPASWNQGTRHKTVPLDSAFRNRNRNFDDCFPVPGLGFDFPHFFATHPNAGRHCFNSGFVVPFVDGGFYLPTSMYGEQPAAQPAEGTQAAEQPAEAEEPASRETSPSTWSKPLPVPKQQEYVFVRRDGTLIFAVAYSWINDRLQYVTEEGIRRTVPRNALDLDATQQFNDQRGVFIQPPA